MTVMEQRIIELETRLTFQDDLLQKLDTVVIRQQQEIAELKIQVQSLIEQLRQVDSRISSDEDGPPPHY